MFFIKKFYFSVIIILIISCTSTKSTLKNIDNNSPLPDITNKNIFVLRLVSKDIKYGFDKDYPINVFFDSNRLEDENQKRYLNALAGPNGETIQYQKIGICCPFPSKNTFTGAGIIDIYEIKWEGLKTPIKLYINKYEKGILMAPNGFSIKK